MNTGCSRVEGLRLSVLCDRPLTAAACGIFERLSAKVDRLLFRLKVGSRLKPPEAAPAESRLKARWAL
jgi:hypothetical protein